MAQVLGTGEVHSSSWWRCLRCVILSRGDAADPDIEQVLSTCVLSILNYVCLWRIAFLDWHDSARPMTQFQLFHHLRHHSNGEVMENQWPVASGLSSDGG
jgi:hypothetical protein